MKKLIKNALNRLRYPYICTHENLVSGRSVRFHVTNPVEGFRLQKFGGEKDQLLALLDLLRPYDVLYDIGASVGAWSIPAALKATHGAVVSFEPDPENRERLAANYALNGISNFHIMPVAVGEQTGELELFSAGANAASPSLRPVNGIARSIKVPIITVDSLHDSEHIPYPTVIKIDIEGAEMMALRGMRNLLSGNQSPRALVLELHPKFLPAFGTDLTAIFQLLIECGYRVGDLASRDEQVICTWFKG